MLTLLVLIHKSADELNSVKKELVLCKQKYELASTQLQSMISFLCLIIKPDTGILQNDVIFIKLQIWGWSNAFPFSGSYV